MYPPLSFNARINILDKFIMGITIWYQSRLIRIVPWVIKMQSMCQDHLDSRCLSYMLYLVKLDQLDFVYGS